MLLRKNYILLISCQHIRWPSVGRVNVEFFATFLLDTNKKTLLLPQ